MAVHGWGTARPLAELIYQKGHLFDFFQAVRLLEILAPEKVPLGEGSEPEKEAVRFKSNVEMSFPASDLSDIISAEREEDPAQMIVNFMGLAGALGALPDPYAELILERKSRKDTAFKDFLDIFNHRLISLLYRIWKIYRIGFDSKAPDQTHFAKYLYCLIGLGTEGLHKRMQVKDRALLHYTALLNQKPRSMPGLELILADYFQIKIKGNQLCGMWYRMEDDQATHIGYTGQNQILGHNAVLGTRIWNQQGAFELLLGPLKFNEFLAFLPIGSAYIPLFQLTRFYAGVELEFDFVLFLEGEAVPGTRLGNGQTEEKGARLGWTTWLGSQDFDQEQGQVRIAPRLFTPEYYPAHLLRDMGIDPEAPSS